MNLENKKNTVLSLQENLALIREYVGPNMTDIELDKYFEDKFPAIDDENKKGLKEALEVYKEERKKDKDEMYKLHNLRP